MQREGPGQRLNKDQQRTLEAYIQRCDNLGMPALVPQLIDAAQRIIDVSLSPGQEPEPLSKNWISRHLAKHPYMRRVKQKIKEIDRSASEEMAIYRRHFRDYQREVEEKGILPGNTYNMDGQGFALVLVAINRLLQWILQ